MPFEYSLIKAPIINSRFAHFNDSEREEPKLTNLDHAHAHKYAQMATLFQQSAP